MPDSSLAAANAAAAGDLTDTILAGICQAIDLIGEGPLAEMIAAKIDIPWVPESAEVAGIKFLIQQVHATFHKPTPTT